MPVSETDYEQQPFTPLPVGLFTWSDLGQHELRLTKEIVQCRQELLHTVYSPLQGPYERYVQASAKLDVLVGRMQAFVSGNSSNAAKSLSEEDVPQHLLSYAMLSRERAPLKLTIARLLYIQQHFRDTKWWLPDLDVDKVSVPVARLLLKLPHVQITIESLRALHSWLSLFKEALSIDTVEEIRILSSDDVALCHKLLPLAHATSRITPLGGAKIDDWLESSLQIPEGGPEIHVMCRVWLEQCVKLFPEYVSEHVYPKILGWSTQCAKNALKERRWKSFVFHQDLLCLCSQHDSNNPLHRLVDECNFSLNDLITLARLVDSQPTMSNELSGLFERAQNGYRQALEESLGGSEDIYDAAAAMHALAVQHQCGIWPVAQRTLESQRHHAGIDYCSVLKNFTFGLGSVADSCKSPRTSWLDEREVARISEPPLQADEVSCSVDSPPVSQQALIDDAVDRMAAITPLQR